MREHINIRWRLVVYDILILSAVEFLLLAVYRSNEALTLAGGISQAVLSFLCVFLCRFLGGIYSQIWRYGGIQCYIRLLVADSIAFAVNVI